jgi:hypothetical protein
MDTLKEGMGFREFVKSAEVGGSGYYYDYGSSPSEKNLNDMAQEDFEKWNTSIAKEERREGIDNILHHIKSLSDAALAKCENLSEKDKQSPYIRRQLDKAKGNLREAYLRLMDLNR